MGKGRPKKSGALVPAVQQSVAEKQLLNSEEVLSMVPLSRSAWWNGVKQGALPAPIKIGGSTFWKKADILELMENGSGKSEF